MLLNLIRQAKQSEQEAKALKECTFSPNLHLDTRKRSVKPQKSERLDASIYERNRAWADHREHRLEDERQQLHQIPADCTFKPRVNDYRPEQIASYPKELRKSTYMRDALAYHYYRMEKARSKSPSKGSHTPDYSQHRDSSFVRTAERDPLEKIHKIPRSKLEDRGRADTPGHVRDRLDNRKSLDRVKVRQNDRLHRLITRDKTSLHDELMSLDLDGYESPTYN